MHAARGEAGSIGGCEGMFLNFEIQLQTNNVFICTLSKTKITCRIRKMNADSACESLVCHTFINSIEELL